MMAYWSSLAETGQPEGSSWPEWPPYEATRDNTLVLQGGEIHMVDGIRSDKCDFWDTFLQFGQTRSVVLR
jgi:carboxylesterase type B